MLLRAVNASALLPYERIREVVFIPLKRVSCRKAISANIKTELAASKPQRQAVAIALSVARKGKTAKDEEFS